MYQIGPVSYARAYGSAAIFGVLLGLAWAILLPAGARFLGFFIFFLAIGLGYLSAEVVERATNHKRGPAIQGAAVFGLVFAYVARNLLLGVGVLPLNDLFGYIVVGIACVVAIGRLR